MSQTMPQKLLSKQLLAIRRYKIWQFETLVNFLFGGTLLNSSLLVAKVDHTTAKFAAIDSVRHTYVHVYNTTTITVPKASTPVEDLHYRVRHQAVHPAQ